MTLDEYIKTRVGQCEKCPCSHVCDQVEVEPVTCEQRLKAWYKSCAKMTEIYFDKKTFLWRCSACGGGLNLPGIGPYVKMLKEQGWKFCPHCGEEIEYPKEG